MFNVSIDGISQKCERGADTNELKARRENMAGPIPLELPPRDPCEELRSRLEQVAVANAEQKDPLGFWGVLKIFRSENLRRGLAVVNSLLEAWGKNFSTRKSP